MSDKQIFRQLTLRTRQSTILEERAFAGREKHESIDRFRCVSLGAQWGDPMLNEEN